VFADAGSITGKVVDIRSGELLAGTNILVMDTPLGAATNLDGEFNIAAIEPGSYNVRISVIGYNTIIKNRVVVRSGKSTYINVELE
jgi:hypothetical protein